MEKDRSRIPALPPVLIESVRHAGGLNTYAALPRHPPGLTQIAANAGSGAAIGRAKELLAVL